MKFKLKVVQKCRICHGTKTVEVPEEEASAEAKRTGEETIVCIKCIKYACH